MIVVWFLIRVVVLIAISIVVVTMTMIVFVNVITLTIAAMVVVLIMFLIVILILTATLMLMLILIMIMMMTVTKTMATTKIGSCGWTFLHSKNVSETYQRLYHTLGTTDRNQTFYCISVMIRFVVDAMHINSLNLVFLNFRFPHIPVWHHMQVGFLVELHFAGGGDRFAVPWVALRSRTLPVISPAEL